MGTSVVGASVGGRGGRYSVHSSGRRTVSAGGGVVPGVYYQKTSGGGSTRSGGARSQAATQQVAPPTSKKPGLFAPKGERQLYKAVKAQDIQAIKRVGAEHPDFRLPSYSLAGLMMLTSDRSTCPSALGASTGPRARACRRWRGRRSGRADGGSGTFWMLSTSSTACDRAHRTVGKRPGWLSYVCHAGSEVLNCP